MRLRIDRRAWPGTVLLAAIGLVLSFFLPSHPVLPFLIITVLHLCFFRDLRGPVPGGNTPLAAASGTVAEVESLVEDSFIKEEAWRIGIFLSIFDAHITTSPVNGRISWMRYVPGRFCNALNPNCSKVNASNWIGIENERGRFLVRQISGAIARKIFCDVQEDDVIGRGQKLGIICYGSRVEIFIPKRLFVPAVQKGDKVHTGETSLGSWETL